MTAVSSATTGNLSDEEYGHYLARFAAKFKANVMDGAPLFKTDAEGLFEVYLAAFGEADRQHHTCHACKQFIERFGGLVTIGEDGSTKSPIWDEADAPELYKASVRALDKAVRKAKVTGVFLSKDKVWGTPVTGQWTHFAVSPPAAMIFNARIFDAGQVMAEKKEDYAIVSRALAEFTLEHLEQALKLLETETLYRSEKVKGPVKWLRDLHVARSEAKVGMRNNIVWRAVATAPAGFCHPRSSMAGTLLEDIAAGLPFDDVSRRFAAKMHPLQYQRPQAPPAAGNIAQGEKVIAALGAERSLLRRYARLEDVQKFWQPVPKSAPKQAEGGVFGHLKAKGAAPTADIESPAITMTWDKFSRTVLPEAEQIEFFAAARRDNYAVLVTAVDMDAPPIIQWDMPEDRNPVSWYLWNGGSTPAEFDLLANTWHAVSAITLKPSMWRGDKFKHQGNGVMFLIEGAKDRKRPGNAGLALFPEILKAEFHAVRATIEAHSRSGQLEGLEESNASGILLSSGQPWNAEFRVTVKGRRTKYRLDRWD